MIETKSNCKSSIFVVNVECAIRIECLVSLEPATLRNQWCPKSWIKGAKHTYQIDTNSKDIWTETVRRIPKA